MRKMLAPFAAALLASAGVYGALATADRRLPPPEDPWLNEWRAAGLRAEFRAETDDPVKGLLFWDARERFKKAGLLRLPLRNYLIAQTSAQVFALPDERVLLEELPQGRSLEHRLKPKGPTIHAVRAGRWVLLLSTQPKMIPLFGRTTLPKKTLDSIFQAFEDVAR